MMVIQKSRGMIAMVIICILFLQFMLSVKAENKDGFEYLSLGDSIAKGYTVNHSKLKAYPDLLQEYLQERLGQVVHLTNKTKNGICTSELKDNILTDKEVLDILSRAELITVTIGSNDLMDEFKRVCQQILKRTEKFHRLDEAMIMLKEEMQKHPTLVFAVLAALTEWDYESFEADWQQTMEIINYYKKDTAPIIVTNIYNPTGGLDLPESVNKVVVRVINKMNHIIEKNANVYHYKIADLSHLRIEEYVQQDGLHPDQRGQQLIADAVLTAIMEPVKVERGKEEKHMEAWSVVCIGITGIILLILGLQNDQKKHE